MDFERIFDLKKTRKNSYMIPLCITNLKYGGHGQEIWSFSLFLSQTGDFR
jgi:hypothetical protein